MSDFYLFDDQLPKPHEYYYSSLSFGQTDTRYYRGYYLSIALWSDRAISSCIISIAPIYANSPSIEAYLLESPFATSIGGLFIILTRGISSLLPCFIS